MNITEGLHEGSRALYLILGSTMFAGKTSEVRRQAKRLTSVNIPVVVVTPSEDVRFGFEAGSKLTASHDGATMDVLRLPHNLQVEPEAYKQLETFHWIIIDEAQMFGEDLVGFVDHWYNERGKSLIVAGLTSNIQDKKWGNIVDLIPMGVTDIFWCKSICPTCKVRGATNTRRRSNSGADPDQVVVGGADIYYVVCPDCDKK